MGHHGITLLEGADDESFGIWRGRFSIYPLLPLLLLDILLADRKSVV